MNSKENINVHLFPKNVQEAIAFEYMKRRTSKFNGPVEDMVEIYLDAKNLAEASLREGNKDKDENASGWDNPSH
ncbi:hypothetical protein AKUH3B101J_09070 [Apilactobacillus kunkeei]|nr:hypothetical protein AKUH3B104J_09070 [Apilactobacillus kunkeei]CAI2615837.1 hypothetical protein AKUH3B101J_09070 [Apilactobacillus kunkeei]